MKNQEKQAFPFFHDYGKEDMTNESGLSKREYFAILCMQGLASKYNLKEPNDQEIISKMAVELADSLLTELEREAE